MIHRSCFRMITYHEGKQKKRSPEWDSGRMRGARRYPFSARIRTRAPSRSTPWTLPRPPLWAHEKGGDKFITVSLCTETTQSNQTFKRWGHARTRRGVMVVVVDDSAAGEAAHGEEGPGILVHAERAPARARRSPSSRPRPPLFLSLSLLQLGIYSPRSAREPMAGWGRGRPRLPNPGVREIPRTDRSRGLSPPPRRAAPVAPPLF